MISTFLMSNKNTVIRFYLNGGGFTASHWLKHNFNSYDIPDFIEQQLINNSCHITKDHIDGFTHYSDHLKLREPLRIYIEALDALGNSKGRKQISTTQVSQAKSLHAEVLLQNEGNISNEAVLPFSTRVVPFGAKTGRDTHKGPTINSFSKRLWPFVLAPPDGSCYVLLDYEQQEPAIVAMKSGAEKILRIYQAGDLYEALNAHVTDGKLNRKEFKELFMQSFYGSRAKAISQSMNLDEALVLRWVLKLKQAIAPLNYWLDMQLFRAKRKGEVRSMDWRMTVTKECSDLSLRNWPVQASGADIMRRACFNLDKVGIPLLLTNHDSFLIRLENKDYDHQLSLALTALGDASAEVLGGFTLKSKVELVIPSTDF